MKYLVGILSVLFFSSVKVNAQQADKSKSAYKSITPEVIYYTSDTVKLKGYLYKPKGKGPFPVFMWNHDMESDPDSSLAMANYWVKQGFIFFKPIRSGQGDNPGKYILVRERFVKRRRGEMAQLQFRQVYALHKDANRDVIAALKWIKKQPYSDTNKIVIAGGGYGGIQTLLTAEKDAQFSLGIKCFIAMAPAATVWDKMWGDSLGFAANIAKKPIFILQAQNDYTLGPCQILGSVLEKKGKPNLSKIFPVHGNVANHEDGYTAFFADPNAWGKDVMKFMMDCGVKGKK